jgi:hypothetical protein
VPDVPPNPIAEVDAVVEKLGELDRVKFPYMVAVDVAAQAPLNPVKLTFLAV